MDQNWLRPRFDLDRDIGLRRRVVESIRQQVEQHLADAHRVGFDRGELRGHLDGDPPRQRRRHVADEIAEVHGLLAELEGAGLGVRQGAQVLDQPREVARLLQQLREVVLIARVDAVEQPFDAALQDGQRRPQLVGDVGHELPPEAVLLAEGSGDPPDDEPEDRDERHGQRHRHRRDPPHLLRRPPEQRDQGAGAHGGQGDERREGAAHASHETPRHAAARKIRRLVFPTPWGAAVAPPSFGTLKTLPYTVSRYRGTWGSGSSLRRMFFTWLSMARSKASASVPRAASSKSAPVNTRPGWRARVARIWNSVGVRSMSSPPRRTLM